MPIFKYTVGNKENKKLNGTVEAPDEKTARTELNNLGFSILSLQETRETPQLDKTLTKFIFEAVDRSAKLITGSIPAKTQEEALNKLSTEYALTVSAIWQENATEEQIKLARQNGQHQLQKNLTAVSQPSIPEEPKSIEDEKKEVLIKNKIETILSMVNTMLKNFENEFLPDQKAEINKKIDKLLRIKNSTNLDYILQTAEELLEFIQSQEKYLAEKGHFDKRLELQLSTKKLLDEIHKSDKPQSISEDILSKINKWEITHKQEANSGTNKFIENFLTKIKNLFSEAPEIKAIKEQIKVYNKQIWEFVKLYFKEPTPEYKNKVKDSIKTIWKARLKAKENLKQLKRELKSKKQIEKVEEHLILSFVQELNSFTGWLLAFYIIYYICSLYLITKDFGFSNIPRAFFIYDSNFFKYILVIVFLLHGASAIKINFFKKSVIANFIIVPIFLLMSLLTILNF